MSRANHWVAGKAIAGIRSEVQLGETVPGDQDGHIRETFTFYANRFSRRQFERKLAEVAAELGVRYSVEVKAGLLLCDIAVTAEGEQDPVDRFRRYAIGLSAASDGDSGGTGP